MKKIPLFGITGIILAGLLSACDTSYFDNEIEDFTFDGTVNAPLGTATYTLTELFDELEIEDLKKDPEDPTGPLIFSYEQDIEGGTNNAFDVSIKDVIFNDDIDQPVSSGVVFGTAIDASTANFLNNNIDPQSTDEKIKVIDESTFNQKLTRAYYSGGTLMIDLTSSFDTELSVTLGVPSLKNKSDGNAFSRTITLNRNGIDPDTENIEINLDEYEMDFTHNGTDYNTTFNEIAITLTVEFNFAAGDVLEANDNISYTANLSDAVTEVVFGDFLQETFNVADSDPIALDFFDTFGEGGIEFADASMTLKATNGFGFPIGINLTGIEAEDPDGASIALEYDNGFILPAGPGENIAVINEIPEYDDDNEVTTIILNKDNSNLNALLNSKPTLFNIGISGAANPANNTLPTDPSYVPNQNFFATTNDGLAVKVTIKAPLNVKFTDLAISPDPIEIDLGEDLDSFSKFNLNVSTINEIPLSGSIKLNFVNGAGTTPLLEKTLPLFRAAPVDDAGKSNGETPDTTTLIFESDEIEILKNVTDIELEITFNSTEDADSVILAGEDQIVLSIGALVGVNITGEDDNE